MLLDFLLCFAAWTALALAMDRHHEDAWPGWKVKFLQSHRCASACSRVAGPAGLVPGHCPVLSGYEQRRPVGDGLDRSSVPVGSGRHRPGHLASAAPARVRPGSAGPGITGFASAASVIETPSRTRPGQPPPIDDPQARGKRRVTPRLGTRVWTPARQSSLKHSPSFNYQHPRRFSCATFIMP